MTDLNKVTLIGNVVREPEPASARRTVTRFALATHYEWLDATPHARQRVEFHDLVAFGQLGAIVRQKVSKGMRLRVEGQLRKIGYVARDGAKRVATLVVAESITLLGARTDLVFKVEPSASEEAHAA